METSSPLATLHSNHPAPFGQRCNEYTSSFLAPCSYEPRNFNFRDMSMLRAKPDYFSFNPARGSSPTTSLAADLSQNFHIERSPALPTPRRTLFNNPSINALCASRDVITPPIPSSSPGPEIHHMETSPLPHKPPYSAEHPAPVGIPTPDPTPMDDSVTEPPSSLPRPESVLPARPYFGHQRRISNGVRPSLKKGYSMNQVSSKANGTAQSNGAPFLFGPGASQPPKPILESFADSPPSERKLPPSNSSSDLCGPPLPRLVYPENGSPIGPVRRMSSARGPAPRVGLGRRTQSLQCGQPMRPTMRTEKRCCTEGSFSPSKDMHEARALSLPHFKPEDEVDALPRITQQTLLDVMDGSHSDKLQDVTVIDCRFEYEFEGGHIDGALNFNDKDALTNELFDPTHLPPSPSTAVLTPTEPSRPCASKTLILHCEYSHQRAPLMARHIRQRDRIHNRDHYPHLTYPEIYILDGGYASFFQAHPQRCFPQAYVEMNSQGNEDAAERGMAKVKRRAKLARAQTYAFGQSTGSNCVAAMSAPSLPVLEDSPIPALPFSKPSVRDLMDVDAMDLDEEMDEAAKRRSITFDSPSLPLSAGILGGSSLRWLSRGSSY